MGVIGSNFFNAVEVATTERPQQLQKTHSKYYFLLD